MKYKSGPLVIKAISLVGLFMVAMVSLLLMLDLVFSPVLAEIFRNPIEQDWCGIFSRCASQIQQSFFEYLFSGAPWRKLDIGAILSRAKSAAILGLFIGGGIGVMSFFLRHR